MKVFTFAVAIMAGMLHVAHGADFLVRVDAGAAQDLPVIELVDDYALLIADDEMLRVLERAGSKFTIIDIDPREKMYVFVFPFGESLESIARFGTIVDRYDECVLLRTSPDKVAFLNGLKVELSRLMQRPITRRAAGPYDPGSMRVTRDTLIAEMLEAVEPDSILHTVTTLQEMYTRYAMSDSNKIIAVNWIREMLQGYGCDSVYQQTFSAVYGDNVVGIRTGEEYPSTQNYVLIGAHLDDVPSYGYAPGADDNASGVAAVLEAARVMGGYEFSRTIRFAAFNAEEQGLIGSDSLAAFAGSQSDTIIAALCYDMIGYVAGPALDSMRLRYTTAVPGCSLFACDFYRAVADTYTQLKIRPVRYTGTTGSSDHASFWRHGYVSTGGIELTLCPGYHTVGDTIGPTGFNNITFATQVVQTAIAALATLAVPIDSAAGIDECEAAEGLPLLVVRPNPGIRFDIAFAVENDLEDVDLVVYDCAGRSVVRLASGMRSRGIYTYHWDGRDAAGAEAPAGVYFVLLSRDMREEMCEQMRKQVRKTVLLR